MTEVTSSHFGKPHPVIGASLEATGQTLASQRCVLSFLVDIRKFTSVVDFGCAQGSWLHAARQLGATELRGYDIPEIPLEARGLSTQEFFPVDLTQEVKAERKFDLAICLEVAEHLPPASASVLIRSLTQSSDWVLFGAAMPYQGGMGHVNENWIEYWAALFKEVGFHCYDILRPKFWPDTRVAYYYRQNTCLYVRPGSHYALKARGYAPSAYPPSLVHPELFLKIVSMRSPANHDLVADVKQYYQWAWKPPTP